MPTRKDVDLREIVKCDVCHEATHRRANGDKRCPKHLKKEAKRAATDRK